MISHRGKSRDDQRAGMLSTLRTRVGDSLDVGPRPDAASVLTVFLVLTYAVPSDLTLGTLGGAGSPGALWSLAAGLWWSWDHLQRRRVTRPIVSPPVRLAALIFLLACVVSYAVAATRPLPSVEASQADTGLLKILGWTALLLIATDGLPSADRLLVILRRTAAVGGCFAVLGLAQFVTGQSFVNAISIPGFARTEAYLNVSDRSGFIRAAATAMQPLEYAVVICMILPLALNLAITDTSRSVVARWWPAIALTFAATLSVSRSTLLGVAAVIAVLAPAWAPNVRRVAAMVGAMLAIGTYVLVPGMAGTVLNLFTTVGQDHGTASRTDSYSLVFAFFSRAPLFGRGVGTFLPEYRILDNEYLLYLIEGGVVGLICMLALLIAGIRSAWAARGPFATSLERAVGQALIAAFVAGGVLMGFFDAFSFPKAGATLFLFLGLSGALWRFSGNHTGWRASSFSGSIESGVNGRLPAQ